MLDSVHVEGARIITGGTKLCCIEKLFADLGWDTLQERRNKQKLVTMYKTIYGITSNYLTELIPPLVREGSPYRLRNSKNFELLHANTNLYSNNSLEGRKENPQKPTQLSSRSHPRHLVGKKDSTKDTIIDITSDSQVNSNFPNRWSQASLTFNNYFYLLLYLYIT